MGKTRELFKKIREIMQIRNKKIREIHAKMDTVKDIWYRNSRCLKEVVRIHGRTIPKDLNDPDNHDGVITHLEPDILECKVKWALGSITMNKASRGGRIPAEIFRILKDDAVKVLHSIYQQIWVTQQWPQDWKR